MAGKQTENQLLFSAISSPFDSLPSVLLPPTSVPLTQQKEVSANESQGKSTSLPELPLSLQPHLAQSQISSQKEQEILSHPASGSPAPPTYSQHDITQRSPILPPATSSPTTGNLLARKPTSKYVIPPEIGSISTQKNAPIATDYYQPPPITRGSHSSNIPPTKFMIPEIPSGDSVQVPFSTDANKIDGPSPNIPASFEAMATSPPIQSGVYYPVIHHWFFCDAKQSPSVWTPFSFTDSLNLEEAFRQGHPQILATDSGRYDVNVAERKRLPIFWESEDSAVSRCSWFRRGYSESVPLPYSEEDAEKLEEIYKDATQTGIWHRQVELTGGVRVILNSPYSIQHYQLEESSECANIVSISDTQQTPQVVRRGADDFTIPDGAAEQVDHLMFLIHGIGTACDLRFRCVEECVDDFRSMGEDLLMTHFKESIDVGLVGRVEVLPISWHKALHGDATGLDAKLKLITLRSIPKFREFTNDTLLDVLFFTSPVYCQHIMDTVASEMERLLIIFKKRIPSFCGKISVGGHSLGSIILFDLLMHQNPHRTASDNENKPTENKEADPGVDACVKEEVSDLQTMNTSTSRISFEMGEAGTGQPLIVYPQLSFKPEALFLMGSPVAMFVTVRGIDIIGPNFKLPTCDRVFNIFHPFDPVAYRIETLIDPSLTELRPVLIPHHKGRKRMHLELKDTIERVGLDIKNKIVDSLQATWNAVYQMYAGGAHNEMGQQAIEEQISRLVLNTESETPGIDESVFVGSLNSGRRIDYVLQEKPYESLTEYIFALQAHLTYWQSEDTLLMIMKELYKPQDILCDSELQKKRSSQVLPTSVPNIFVPPTPLQPSPLGTSSSASAVLPAIPLMSTSDSSNIGATPPVTMNLRADSNLRTLGGRPVFDPSVAPSVLGMDPTASPATNTQIGPPPVIPNVSFNRKS